MRLTVRYLGEQAQMQGRVWPSYKAKVSAAVSLVLIGDMDAFLTGLSK